MMSREQYPPAKAKLALNSLENARRSLVRVIRWYQHDQISSEKYRNLIYGLMSLLAYLKTEKGFELEVRVARIESLMQETEWYENKRAKIGRF